MLLGAAWTFLAQLNGTLPALSGATIGTVALILGGLATTTAGLARLNLIAFTKEETPSNP